MWRASRQMNARWTCHLLHVIDFALSGVIERNGDKTEARGGDKTEARGGDKTEARGGER